MMTSHSPQIMNLRYISRLVLRRKLVLITIFTGSMLLVIAAYLLKIPVFEASATLLVGQPDINRSDDAPFRSAEWANSQARIADSQPVIRAAIEKVGIERFGSNEAFLSGLGAKLREFFNQKPIGDFTKIQPIDVATAFVSRSLFVRVEPNTNFIRVSFRSTNPQLAVEMADAVSRAFVDRQIELNQVPGAADFFAAQKKKFDEEVQRVSRELDSFSSSQGLYAADEQRSLLLKRAADLSAALSTARASIAEKEGQRVAVSDHLRRLRQVAQNPFVSELVDALGSPKNRIGSPREDRVSPGDPPLITVRVYQDSLALLFKIDADLHGLSELQKSIAGDLDKINKDLTILSHKEGTFLTLRRELALASQNSETYSKRYVEEKLNSDVRNARISNVRIVQSAIFPSRSIAPNGWIYLAVGIFISSLLSVGSIILHDFMSSPG